MTHQVNIPHRAPLANRTADPAEARMSAGKMTFRPRGEELIREEVNLGDLLDAAMRLVRFSLPPGVRMRCQVPPEPIHVNGNRADIYQAVLTLCGQTCAQIQQSDGTLMIRLAHIQPGSSEKLPELETNHCNYALISVVGKMEGIPFEPALDQDTLNANLEMLQARRTVQEHDGEFLWRTVPRQLIEFSIFLPTTV